MLVFSCGVGENPVGEWCWWCCPFAITPNRSVWLVKMGWTLVVWYKAGLKSPFKGWHIVAVLLELGEISPPVASCGIKEKGYKPRDGKHYEEFFPKVSMKPCNEDPWNFTTKVHKFCLISKFHRVVVFQVRWILNYELNWIYFTYYSFIPNYCLLMWHKQTIF